MTRTSKFKLGDWTAECDRCAEVYYASELVKEWTGWRVCQTCYEPRHEGEQVPHVRPLVHIPQMEPSSNAQA